MLKEGKVSIRPLEESDAPLFYKWYNDQEVNLWASGAWPPITMLTKDEIWQTFFEGEEHRYVILTEAELPIGTIGFRNHNIPARSAELFIVIGEKEYWGKGYGTDALSALAGYLFLQWNLHRLELDTWDGNVRAIKAYQKMGFEIEGRLREARYIMGEYRDAVIMGLLKKDFLAQHMI